MQLDRRWHDLLWYHSDSQLRFRLCATEDVLPSASVLKCWRQPGETGICPLGCIGSQGPVSGSLMHILTSCQLVVEHDQQSRIVWRHDSVLLAIYLRVLAVVNRHKKTRQRGKRVSAPVPRKVISFVSEKGAKRTAVRAVPMQSVIATATDWKFQFDIDAPEHGQTSRQMFPLEIIEVSDKRPDGVVWSCSAQVVIWIELTSPWEENMEKSHWRKKEKYAKLAADIRAKGWQVHPLEVEVGCRGIVNQIGFQSMCKVLGFKKAEQSELQFLCELTALQCSHAIWCCRFSKEWAKKPLLDVSKWHGK